MFKKGYKMTEEHKEKIRLANLGKKRKPTSLETRKKISEALKGKMPENFKTLHTLEINKKRALARKGLKISQEWKDKISLSRIGDKNWAKRPEVRAKIRKTLTGKYTGEKNWNWKGGITPENVKIRTSAEYNLWRKAVLTRDNFTCQKYGIRGGKLVAHHINNFSEFPELRFAIDNGITLSEKAHKEFHKEYGRRNNTLEQIQEFIK